MKGSLVLENGRIFEGKLTGSTHKAAGEVVFHTGMTGYQEILTDPSYASQIVVMTYPLIGNYGINPIDFEASRPWLHGFVTGESCNFPNHYQSNRTLADYLDEHKIVGLTDVDTRSLVRTIRSSGTLRGTILPVSRIEANELMQSGQVQFGALNTGLVDQVTTKTIRYASKSGLYHVVVLDFGAKENMLRSLIQKNCKVTVVPARTPFETIQALMPDGILLSNGPGDPQSCMDVLPALRLLVERYPVFGICLGHQLLCMTFGASTFKMGFGHRGSNHPVKELATGRVQITSQNHGYGVIADTLHADLKVTHVHVNDGTVEGVEHRNLPCFSVQYHPEACPGPKDSEYLFDQFIGFMAERKGNLLVYATSI